MQKEKGKRKKSPKGSQIGLFPQIVRYKNSPAASC